MDHRIVDSGLGLDFRRDGGAALLQVRHGKLLPPR
jgi:hypothetical protein